MTKMTMADLQASKCRFAFVIDRSGTMSDPLEGSPMNRLESTREYIKGIARGVQHLVPDGEGFFACYFGKKVSEIKVGISADRIDDYFKEFWAVGSTNTAEALQKMSDKMFEFRATKGDKIPMCVFLFTDGKPDDEAKTAQVIVNISKRIDSRNEFGIQIIQVGNDKEACEYLTVLNDKLEGVAKHDIVAVTNLSEVEDIAPPELVLSTFTE